MSTIDEAAFSGMIQGIWKWLSLESMCLIAHIVCFV